MAEEYYKGWRILAKANKVPDGDGWRVYPFSVERRAEDSYRFQNLSVDRVFPTAAAAEQAGIEYARRWIDTQEAKGGADG
jgi:hypothetical protein